MHLKTDIIISVHATREHPMEQYFEKCVESLVANTPEGSYRLIFVDDYCDRQGRNIVESVAGLFRDALLIRTHKQRWFTRAYNLGLRMVRTPRAVLLNADCEMGPGWLEELHDVANEYTATEHISVGLVGSVYSAEEPRRLAPTWEPGYVTGHCWLVNMQALFDMSAKRSTPGIYLDETRQDAIHIRSDVYACYDLNRLGYATLNSFKSHVGHHGGKSWGHNLGRISNLTLEQVD